MAIRFTPSGAQSYQRSKFETSPGVSVTTAIVKKSGGGSSGGGGVSMPSSSYTDVKIQGTTVFINGQGYSVPISSQAEFIKKQTGGAGTSAQQAIQQAQEESIKQVEQIRLQEIKKRKESGGITLGTLGLGTLATGGTAKLVPTPSKSQAEKARLTTAGSTGFILGGFADQKKEDLTKLEYWQQLPYQQKGTMIQGGIIPTTQDLWRLDYREQAGRAEIGLFALGQRGQIDKIAAQKAVDISNELQNIGKENVDLTYKTIQNKVNNGEISLDKAQKEMDSYVKKENERLSEEFAKRHTGVMTPYVEEAAKMTDIKASEIYKKVNKIGKEYAAEKFVGSVLVGVSIGVISTLLPPVGIGLAITGGISAISSAPEIISYAKQDPWGFSANIAGGIFGAFAGGFAGKKIISIQNTAKVNDYLANKKLKESDVKSSSILTAKATKVGIDSATGKTIWNIESKGITKFINKKTGKVIDTSISIGNYKVIAESAGKAVKSVVDGTAISLRETGWSLSRSGNTLNVKGRVSYIKGKAMTYPTSVKDISIGTAKYDIYSGGFGMKVKQAGIKLKAEVYSPPRQSATSNFISKMLGKYREAKITKGGKVWGIEEMYKSKIATDIGENFYVTKTGKIKFYKKEPIPSRDISVSYTKAFTPKAFEYGKLDIIESKANLPGSLQELSKVSQKAQVKLISQTAQQAQMSAFASDVTKALVRDAKNIPKPIIVYPKTAPGIISSVLIESKYPTYVGGTQLGTDWSKLGMTGNIINDYSEEGYGIKRGEITKTTKTGFDLGYKYSPAVGLMAVQKPAVKVISRERQKSIIIPINSILLGTSQIQPQAYRQQFKQIQITKQIYKIPPYVPPKITFDFIPIIPPPYLLKKPKTAYSWGYPTRTGKTKPGKRAYTPSLGAWQLGITAPKGFKTKQKFSGIGLRPILYKKKSEFPQDYNKQLNKALFGKGKTKKKRVSKRKNKTAKKRTKKFNITKFFLGGF